MGWALENAVQQFVETASELIDDLKAGAVEVVKTEATGEETTWTIRKSNR